jgi:hypothetical protein
MSLLQERVVREYAVKVMTPYGSRRGLLRNCTDTMSSHGSVVPFPFSPEGGLRCLAQANGTIGNTVVFLRMALRHATHTVVDS